MGAWSRGTIAGAWWVVLEKNCGRGVVGVDVYDDEPGCLSIVLIIILFMYIQVYI
jgi:hypothetical protein